MREFLRAAEALYAEGETRWALLCARIAGMLAGGRGGGPVESCLDNAVVAPDDAGLDDLVRCLRRDPHPARPTPGDFWTPEEMERYFGRDADPR